MADTFQNVAIFEKEISLYILGFIDRKELDKRIILKSINEYGVMIESVPEKLNEVIEIMELTLDYGLQLMKEELK